LIFEIWRYITSEKSRQVSLESIKIPYDRNTFYRENSTQPKYFSEKYMLDLKNKKEVMHI